MKIVIPEVPKSLNQLFSMHNLERYRYARDIKTIVGFICKEYKLRKKFPLKIKYTITFDTRRRRDVDNYIGGLKFFTDGLVAGGLIPDDSTEFVESITAKLIVGDKKETVIEI